MTGNLIADNLRYLLLGAWPEGPIGGAALTLLLTVGSALGSAVLGLAMGIVLALPAPAWRRRQPGLPALLAAALLIGVAVAGWWWRLASTPVISLLALIALAVAAAAFGQARRLLGAWVALLRAVPILLLMFWIYFLLPMMFKVDVPGPATVVLALSLVGGAYLAHAVAAGIAALPSGQWRAASALGLGPAEALRHVILPQALPGMLPSFLNQWLSLCKDTSLGYVIAVSELSFVATQVSNRLMVHAAEVFGFAALLYFVLCGSLQLAATLAARRWAPAFQESAR